MPFRRTEADRYLDQQLALILANKTPINTDPRFANAELYPTEGRFTRLVRRGVHALARPFAAEMRGAR